LFNGTEEEDSSFESEKLFDNSSEQTVNLKPVIELLTLFN